MPSSIEETIGTGAISTERQTYRNYVKFDTDKDGKAVLKETKIQGEADKKDKDGLSVNWARLEKEGYTLFSENEFIRYSVKSEDAFKQLVTSEEQRVYIIQSGLNAIQSAKITRNMAALKDEATEPTPQYTLEVIDLREDINEPPQRRSLSGLERLSKLLDGLNLTPEEKRNMLLAAAAQQATASDEGEDSEGEAA